MAKENRYFWLRLYDDFFTSKRIKKLRKLAGGDTYLIIYLKMQLIAMKHDGILQWSGLDDNFADELALELDEEPANVEVTINYLLSCGLAETSDDVTFFFPYAVKNVGSEGSSAKRMRESRARAKLGESSQCANDVRTLCEHRYGEKEIEKEIDIEDISSSLRSEDMGGSAPSEPKAPESGKRTAVKFVPPTLEEVEAYAASRQSMVDPRRFFEYFNTPDAQGRSWRDSKGNPVKNWKQKFLTWEGRDSGKGKPAPAASRTDKPRKSWTELAAEMDAEEGRTT
jgi:predicted phage replisome organizer|nr:MAG TPA: replisome organizer protein [Caudoviricetes sp.]